MILFLFLLRFNLCRFPNFPLNLKLSSRNFCHYFYNFIFLPSSFRTPFRDHSFLLLSCAPWKISLYYWLWILVTLFLLQIFGLPPRFNLLNFIGLRNLLVIISSMMNIILLPFELWFLLLYMIPVFPSCPLLLNLLFLFFNDPLLLFSQLLILGFVKIRASHLFRAFP